MKTETADWLAIAALWALILLAVVLLSGCQPVRPSPVQQASGLTGSTRAYADSNKTNLVALHDHTDDAGKPLLAANTHNNDRIIDNQTQLDQQIAAQAAETAAWHDRFTALSAKWYVWLGKRIEWAIALAVGGWALIGIGGVGLLSFFPGAWLGGIGKQLLNFLPLSHPFTIAANWIRGRQASNAPVTINVNGGAS